MMILSVIAFTCVIVFPVYANEAEGGLWRLENSESYPTPNMSIDKRQEVTSASTFSKSVSPNTMQKIDHMVSVVKALIFNRSLHDTSMRLRIWRLKHKLCQTLPAHFPGCKRFTLVNLLTGVQVPSVDRFFKAFKQAVIYHSLHMKWIEDTNRIKKEHKIPVGYGLFEDSLQDKKRTYNKRWMVTHWPSRRKSSPAKVNPMPIKTRKGLMDSKYFLIGLGK